MLPIDSSPNPTHDPRGILQVLTTQWQGYRDIRKAYRDLHGDEGGGFHASALAIMARRFERAGYVEVRRVMMEIHLRGRLKKDTGLQFRLTERGIQLQESRFGQRRSE